MPLLGLHYLVIPFRPPKKHPWEHFYEVLSAITASFQVSEFKISHTYYFVTKIKISNLIICNYVLKSTCHALFKILYVYCSYGTYFEEISSQILFTYENKFLIYIHISKHIILRTFVIVKYFNFYHVSLIFRV